MNQIKNICLKAFCSLFFLQMCQNEIFKIERSNKYGIQQTDQCTLQIIKEIQEMEILEKKAVQEAVQEAIQEPQECICNFTFFQIKIKLGEYCAICRRKLNPQSNETELLLVSSPKKINKSVSKKKICPGKVGINNDKYRFILNTFEDKIIGKDSLQEKLKI